MPISSPSKPGLSKSGLLVAVVLCLAAVMYFSPEATAEKAITLPAPSAEVVAGLPGPVTASETAVFAGGCFWGIQAVFQHTTGVLNAVSGYAGGQPQDANYPSVSSGSTGHAEAVQVTFDPRQISYAELLQIYFSVAHDPTQLNRQYPDVGPQYRSAVFYASPAQQQQVARYIAQLDTAQVFAKKIVTQVTPLTAFYPAEAYHQNYATLHPDATYIARFDLPKIANLKTLMPKHYRETPLLVAGLVDAGASGNNKAP